MKSYNLAAILLATTLSMIVPALAQSAATTQKRHMDGGDLPNNPKATNPAATASHKQQIGGLPAGTAAPQYGTDWRNAQKQSTQAFSHSVAPAVGGTATKQQ